MRPFLFIRPDSFLTPRLWWFTADAKQPEALDHPQQLSALSGHPLARQVCLLLPACEFLCRRFTLPDKKLRDPSPMLTWMAEESLPEAQDLHWHILRRQGRQLDAFAVPRETLRRWLDICNKAGLQVVAAVPDALMLDYHQGMITLAKMDNSWLVRYGETEFAEVSPPLLPAFLQRLPAADIISSDLLPADLNIKYHASCRAVWRMFISGMSHNKNNILLSFTENRNNKKQTNITAIFAGAIAYSLIIFFSSQLFSLYKVNEMSLRSKKAAEAIYQRYFPAGQPPRNLKYNFERKTKQQGPRFAEIVQNLGHVNKAHSEINISKLEYRAAPLSLRLSVQTESSTRAFISELKKETGFEITENQDGTVNVIELRRRTP
ncbi:type II secretion system protein GspL [Pantoea sp.]|nr:type II secretion system protein GspL [Pantoea sp.]